ncbi:MAG TPA: cation transporter, partial [Gemmatimonadales bacterium]|nr:cation transporter [Gemmatimonadales bacterium]
MTAEVSRGIRTAIVGLGVNAALAVVKIVAGIAGHSQALIADGIESTADVFSSLVVWSGLR